MEDSLGQTFKRPQKQDLVLASMKRVLDKCSPSSLAQGTESPGKHVTLGVNEAAGGRRIRPSAVLDVAQDEQTRGCPCSL